MPVSGSVSVFGSRVAARVGVSRVRERNPVRDPRVAHEHAHPTREPDPRKCPLDAYAPYPCASPLGDFGTPSLATPRSLRLPLARGLAGAVGKATSTIATATVFFTITRKID